MTNPTHDTTRIGTIAPQDMHALGQRQPTEILDVRTPVEFAQVHAVGAVNVPLDQLDADTLLKQRDPRQPIYVICKAGGRASKACARLTAAGFTNVTNIAGGTDAWVAANLPTVRSEARSTISLERQVRIAAGSLVLTGVVLAKLVSPWFWAIPAFVGVGLIFAGVTDWCGMGLLLARMPWNRP